MMLLVGVVFYMPGHCREFPAQAVIKTARHRGMIATRYLNIPQGFLPFKPVGLGKANQDSGVGCPYWGLHGPIYLKYVLWGCGLVIL